MNGPTLNQMHLDAFPISGVGDSVGAFVLGVQFGPMLLAVTDSVEEAFDEWDERHGRRVDFDADASELADYDGDTIQEQTESAMDAGDIRVNDGGTMVWVDHYEWCREFTTVREAGKFWRAAR